MSEGTAVMLLGSLRSVPQKARHSVGMTSSAKGLA
jgi:hypothetical protein